jgi:hypothetical protein
VHSTADLNSVNGNFNDVPDAQQTVDPILRTMGSNPGRASLIILRMVARHLSAVPGHKNLVWVSSDNVFADWRSNQVAIDKSPKEVDSFAMHAQEAMNDAHVAVYPMDVSQLETSAISADIRTRNVELNQAAADTASLNGGSVATNLCSGPQHRRDAAGHAPHPGTHPHGGRCHGRPRHSPRRRLAAALNGVVEDGHATYMVSFSPQGCGRRSVPQHHGQAHRQAQRRYSALPNRLSLREGTSLAQRPLSAGCLASHGCERDCRHGRMPPRKARDAEPQAWHRGRRSGSPQQAGLWMDKLDIFFIQRDDAGIKAQVEGQTLGLRLKPATYQNLLASGVPFEHFVDAERHGLAAGAGGGRELRPHGVGDHPGQRPWRPQNEARIARTGLSTPEAARSGKSRIRRTQCVDKTRNRQDFFPVEWTQAQLQEEWER